MLPNKVKEILSNYRNYCNNTNIYHIKINKFQFLDKSNTVVFILNYEIDITDISSYNVNIGDYCFSCELLLNNYKYKSDFNLKNMYGSIKNDCYDIKLIDKNNIKLEFNKVYTIKWDSYQSNKTNNFENIKLKDPENVSRNNNTPINNLFNTVQKLYSLGDDNFKREFTKKWQQKEDLERQKNKK